MLKALKKKQVYQASTQTESQSVTCGACQYVRQSTDRNPAWQCPGCGKAYAKVNHQDKAEKLTQQELYNKNHAYRRKQQAEQESKQSESLNSAVSVGLSAGTLAFIKGLGKAAGGCVKVAIPANPVLQAIGAVIIVGTLIYAAVKYLT